MGYGRKDKDRYSKDQRFEVVLDNGERPDLWSDAGYGTISNTVSGTAHVTGAKSLSFDKSGTSDSKGMLVRSLNHRDGWDLDAFSSEGQVLSSVYFSDVGDITTYDVYLLMSSGIDNGISYTISGSELSSGWNHLKFDCNNYSQSYGAGLDWTRVKYVGVGVSLNNASDTLSNILVDSVRINLPTASFSFDPNIDNISVSSISINTDPANTARTVATEVIPIQQVDQSGKVPPAGDTNTNAPFVKLTDGSEDLGFQTAGTAGSSSTVVVPVQPLDADGGVIEGGAGGAGGGDSVYSVAQNDFSAVYTAVTQITLTGGIAGLISKKNFIQVVQFPSSGVAVKWVPDKNAFDYNSSTGVLTVTGASFASGDEYDVQVYYTPKSYDLPGNQRDVWRSNPSWEQNSGATLADVTNGTDGDYYYFVDCGGYRYHGLQFATFDGGSATISGAVAVSMQNDGTLVDSCAYSESSIDFLGVDYITGPGVYFIDTPLPVKYLRVKVSAESGDNTCDWTIYHVAKY